MLGARLPRVRPGRDAPCNCPSCSGRPSRWQPRLCSAAGVIQAPPTSGLQPRPPCALANLQSLVPPPPTPARGWRTWEEPWSPSRPLPVRFPLRPTVRPWPVNYSPAAAQASPCASSWGSIFSSPLAFSPSFLSLSATVSSVPFLTHFTCLSLLLGLSLLRSGFSSPTPSFALLRYWSLLTIHALLARRAELHPEVFKYPLSFCPEPGTLQPAGGHRWRSRGWFGGNFSFYLMSFCQVPRILCHTAEPYRCLFLMKVRIQWVLTVLGDCSRHIT